MPIANKHRMLLLLLLAGLPCTAWANAGTPLMWGTFAHLLFGNIAIGVLEGTLLRRRICGKGYHAIALMIAANYFSMYVGSYLIHENPLIVWWKNNWTVLNLKPNLCAMVILLWVLTILLEWPFVWFAMGKDQRHWLKALKASLLLQSSSYLLLVGWYALCSSYSLLNCHLVPPEEIPIPKRVCIYYIGNDDGIYRTRLGREPSEKIAELPRRLSKSERAEAYAAFLVFLADEDDPSKANLMERTYSSSAFNRLGLYPILYRVADTDKVLLTKLEKYPSGKYGDCNQYIGRPFGNAIASDYRFKLDYFSEFGIRLLKRRDQDSPLPYNSAGKEDANGFRWADWQVERKLFALGSPVASWNISNIIHFDNDIILFEFSNHQICLYDHRTNRMALLTQGYGATVANE